MNRGKPSTFQHDTLHYLLMQRCFTVKFICKEVGVTDFFISNNKVLIYKTYSYSAISNRTVKFSDKLNERILKNIFLRKLYRFLSSKQVRNTSITEDTNKLIVWILGDSRASASLWEGQPSLLCRHNLTKAKTVGA